jgi:uncharacterized protein (TIGR02594 family)
MAEVNPQTGQMGTQNYIGYSERRSGNNAWASLFGTVIGAVDQNNVTNIESSVNQTVSDLDQQFYGTDDVVAAVNGQQPQPQPQPQTVTEEADKVAIPKPVQDGIAGIDNLSRASNSGALSQGNYSAQLEARVRALKAKYPGYTGEIDKAVSRAINAPSANMLRDSIIADRKAKMTDRDKMVDDFYKAADKYAGMFGSELTQKITTRSVPVEEMAFVRTKIAEWEADDMVNKKLKADLDLKAAQRGDKAADVEAKEQAALAYGRNQIQVLGKRMLYAAGGIDDMGYARFQKDILDAAKDGFFSDEERKRLLPTMQKLITDVESAKSNLYFGNDAIYSKLNDAGKKELDAGFANLIEPFQKLLVGNDTAALTAISMNAAAIKHSNEVAQLRFLETPEGEISQKLQAAANVAPVIGQYIGTKLASGAADGSSLDAYITGVIAGKIVSDGSSASNMVKGIADSTPARSSAKITKETIDLNMQALADPNTTAEAKANIFKSFFSEGNTDFLRLFDPSPGKDGRSSQQKIYESLTTPEVTDAIKAMNDPAMINQYRQWAEAQLFAMNKPTIDSAKDFAGFNNFGVIVYNKDTREWSAKLDPAKFPSQQAMQEFMTGRYTPPSDQGRAPLSSMRPQTNLTAENKFADLPQFKRVQRDIADLNLYVKRLVPILEASGVKDIDGRLSELTQGLDKEIPKQTRYSYYLNAAIDVAKKGGSAIASGAATVGDYLVPDVAVDIAKGVGQFAEDVTGAVPEGSLLTPDESIKLNESVLPFDGATNQGPINIPDNETVASAKGSKLTPMEVAQDYLGLTEENDSKVISAFIKKSAGTSINPRVTPWCAAFMNALIGASGGEGTGKLNARSFLEYGTPTKTVSEGDIVVFSRGSDPTKGHVGLYAGEVTKSGERFIKVLGGNQGNSVSIAEYPASTLLGVRKPPRAGTKLITIE